MPSWVDFANRFGLSAVICIALLWGTWQVAKELTAAHAKFIAATIETQQQQAKSFEEAAASMNTMAKSQSDLAISQERMNAIIADMARSLTRAKAQAEAAGP